MSKQDVGMLREEELKNKIRAEYFGDAKKFVDRG